MLGWQLQAMLHGRPPNAARQTSQCSTACAVFGNMPYQIRKGMSLTAQAVLRWEVCRAVFSNIAWSCHRNIVSCFKYHKLYFLRQFRLINLFSCCLVNDPFKCVFLQKSSTDSARSNWHQTGTKTGLWLCKIH